MVSVPVSAWAVKSLKSVSEITPEQIGEFITISGTVEQFRAPASRREPYSFQLRDLAGKTIRVGAWPETMTAIKGWNDLATSGTAVSMTAEVIDRDGQFELQILDWAEVRIAGRSSSGDRISSGTAMTTAAMNNETTGAR